MPLRSLPVKVPVNVSRPVAPYEDVKVVWRGDRIEWLLAHGFQDWLLSPAELGITARPAASSESSPTSG